MFRRVFALTAGLSLLLFFGTVVLWVRSNQDNGLMNKGIGSFFAISYHGDFSVFHRVPDGITEIDFRYWKWVLLFLAMPAVWLLMWWSAQRRTEQGICSSCGYSLTGNTSGACPECGTAINSKDVPIKIG
jgi:hypothetical protein